MQQLPVQVLGNALDGHGVFKLRLWEKWASGPQQTSPHHLFFVQGHWQLQHLPVEVLGDALDVQRWLKFGE